MLVDRLNQSSARRPLLRDDRGGQRVTSASPEATYEALEKYGRFLDAFVREMGGARQFLKMPHVRVNGASCGAVR